jgi:PAS domain S-box-containing protein
MLSTRKRAEVALRQVEQNYATLVNSIDGIVWEVDAHTFQFSFVSQKAERLLGYPITRWLTEPNFWREHVHPDDREWTMAFCVNATAEKRDHEFEYRMLAADGRTVWLHDLVTVVLVNDQVTKLRGVMVDITERKRVEAELQQYREHLEELVKDRTAELAVAKAKAEETDRLKSTFLATMSHELRTPLNSILGFTGILLQGLAGPLNAEQTKQLQMVQSSGRHLLSLIKDVLDLSRIEAGQMEMRSESFDMRQLLAKTMHALAPLAAQKHLSLLTDVAPEVAQVTSDPHRVEQILLNLVHNAIKFTDHGEIRLVCRISDGKVLTSVTDTGMGIQPDDLDKLFTAFRQLDSTLVRKHEGTGLGLAICKRLAHLLGGEIWVKSQWEVGSTFTLVLPHNG